ncbi:Hsp20/alpha crystallin family protein [Leptolyngbya cf. ectocarpi LEGE 11479]|uniref:Hsp20/alpha crystallin family protein n=1 Tax=Leptolyngbya cf. ectocarpi LEGE 11479 TaxID=1828722 RepID=A0A928X184_LEPEC|nr:Hsp20/alpha crystallin family protein [Leptolyngbya ectocarpi]MBE9067230.1 Hsp20/alpha crystallin family protein [Leptolyngbya cf. ectocarpi LEGE 11479]
MTKITRWRPFGHIEHWEPFEEIDTLRKEINKLFEQSVLGGSISENGFDFMPSAEIDETDTEIHLKLEVPGMEADDLDIEVTDESVAIKGERKSETRTEEKGEFRSEFHYGKFERLIPMPTRIVKDQVAAEYKAGVLRLTIPKSQEEITESVKVRVA